MDTDHMYLIDLFCELEEAEQEGVPLLLDGEPSSPLQIAKACMIREESCYMRDYLGDERGNVREIRFDKVILSGHE